MSLHGPNGSADGRRALYAQARESGLDPWDACTAAGWDPAMCRTRERWYQAHLAGTVVTGPRGGGITAGKEVAR